MSNIFDHTFDIMLERSNCEHKFSEWTNIFSSVIDKPIKLNNVEYSTCTKCGHKRYKG